MDEGCSQLSQSQPSQYDAGIAVHMPCRLQQYCRGMYSAGVGTNGINGQANGPFPVPQARKVLRKRYHSPPALRNVFLHGPTDTGPVLPKAPLPASRYRYVCRVSAVPVKPCWSLRCCTFCRAEFKEIRLLGSGNFSKVYLAQHRLDGVNYAVKRSAHRVLSDAAKRQWVQVLSS